MNSILFLGFFIAFSIFSVLRAENEPIYHHASTAFTPPATDELTPSHLHLRANIDIESMIRDGTHVRVNGYFERNHYPDPSRCRKLATDRILNVLNTCVKSSTQIYNGMVGGQMSYTRLYLKITALANVHSHQYRVYYQYYTDTTCETPHGNQTLMNIDPVLYCNAGTMSHFESALATPSEDRYDIVFGYFSTPAACANEIFSQMVVGSYWRLNYCVPGSVGDYKYTSCGGGTLTKIMYTSTDGSCSGTGTTINYDVAASLCSSESIFAPFIGYSRPVCLKY